MEVVQPGPENFIELNDVPHSYVSAGSDAVTVKATADGLEFTTAPSTSPGGANTNVQYNDSGAFGGSSNLTWDGTTLKAATITDSGLTSGRVTFAGTAGLLSDSASFLWDNPNKRLTVDGAVISTPNANSLFLGNAPSASYSAGATVFGRGAGIAITSGDENTCIGKSAGAATTTANTNTYVGSRAGASNITGTDNCYVGAITGTNYLGSYNTYIGARTGTGTGAANGFGNVALGSNTMGSISTGFGNICIGYVVGRGITTGSFNTIAGYAAGGSGNSSGITVYGYSAGQNQNSSANSNAFFGDSAGNSNTSGVGNTFVGSAAGYQITSGGSNVCIGWQSGYVISGGTQSGTVSIGARACFLGMSNNSVFLGYATNYNGTNGDGCVMLGYQAGYQDTNANRLYIANSNTTTPLIYGEFDNKILKTFGRLGALSTTEQLRLEYDSSNYLSITINSTGNATFNLTGTTPQFTFSKGIILPAGTATALTAPLKFTMAGSVVLTTPVTGVMETDTDNVYLTKKTAIRESIPGVIFTQTADKSVTNTVTETSIVGSGVGTLTLPANFFVAGKTIRIMMSGVYSTVAVTGDTVTIKVKYGSTVIASSATTSLLAGATNLYWWAEALITCRTTGASGTVQISGGTRYQISATTHAIAEDELNNSVGTTTIDTTASALLDITVTHSAANASNTVKSLVGSFEILN